MPLAQRAPSIGELINRVQALETEVAALRLAQRHTADAVEIITMAIDEPQQAGPQSLDD